MRKVSFRIRKKYFDKIVSREKMEELRSNTEFWRKRLFPPPDVAVFVCGKDVHRRYITEISIDSPEKVLGRPLSAQGRQDITTDSCIVIRLGIEYLGVVHEK